MTFFVLAAALLCPAAAPSALDRTARPAPAIDMSPRFERVASELGLSQNSVTSILQDRKGFLWFGTSDGLNRFDGYEFKVYRYDSFDPGSLSDSDVGVIYEDRAERLWIGTRNGLNLFDRSREVFQKILSTETDPQNVYTHAISGIVADPGGSLWVATFEGGLLRIDLGAEPAEDPLAGAVVTPIPLPASKRASPFYVLGLEVDARGTVWTETTDGIYLVTPTAAGATVEPFPLERFGIEVSDAAMQLTKWALLGNGADGRIFLGLGPGVLTAQNGLDDAVYHRFDTSRKPPLLIESWDAFWVSMKWMVRPADGRIWIASLYGLAIVDPATGAMEGFGFEPGGERGVPESGFTTVYEDAGGVIWLGSNGNGLYRYDPRAARFSRPQRGSNRLALWRGTSVRALCETRGGDLWFSTPAIDLYRMDRATGATVAVDLARSRRLYQVVSIFEDRTGALWFGGTGKVLRLTP